MKKLMMILTVFILLVGCTDGGDNSTDSLKIKDIFPFSENTYYDYDGNMKYAAWDVYVEFVNGNRIQRRVEIADTNNYVEVLENVDGELRLIYGDNDYFATEDFTNLEVDSYELILKEPIELGTKWLAGQNLESEITDMRAEVQTPYGTFTAAIEVTTTTYDDNNAVQQVTKTYYVTGLGLVKNIIYIPESDGREEMEIVTQLVGVEEMEG